MRRLWEIARTGLTAVRLHPLRSLVCVAALAAVLLPWISTLAISEGLEQSAKESALFGADLYVTGRQFGRAAPIPPETADRIRQIQGVTAVVPRIVGDVVLGKDGVHAVLVGLPAEDLPRWAACVEGELPQPGSVHELVIGTSLARKLGLSVGSVIPPFYRNDRRGERLSRIVGVFRPDAPLWQTSMILGTFDAAASIFDRPGQATELLVSCRPEYRAEVGRTILRSMPIEPATGDGAFALFVTARDDLLALLPRDLMHRQGVFNLHFLLAFAIGILVLLVTSGVGLGERRREIGILKATGWQTDEILVRGLAESTALSLAGACLSVLLAWIWLRVFNAWGLAGLYFWGADARPDFLVPFRLTPVPALLAFVFSLAIVLCGTLLSSWRAATTMPREAIR